MRDHVSGSPVQGHRWNFCRCLRAESQVLGGLLCRRGGETNLASVLVLLELIVVLREVDAGEVCLPTAS